MSVEYSSTLRKAGDQPHVFIAYNYQDQDFARTLATALRRDRVSPYTEVGEMTAGDSLIRRLSTTTRPVDCVVPVISVSSVAQMWVERELVEVMKREINWRRVVVVAAKIDSCAVPAFLKGRLTGDFHGLGWSHAYANVRTAILRRIVVEPAVQRPVPAQPPAPRPSVPTSMPPGTRLVYLSYDHGSDDNYRDILVTWSKHPDFARFSFYDHTPTVPVDSEEGEPHRKAIAASIGAANGFLCVIGERAVANPWMLWEVKKADELGKRLIVVRINRECAVPDLLSEVGATCAMSFTFEGIRRAIDEAYGGSALD